MKKLKKTALTAFVTLVLMAALSVVACAATIDLPPELEHIAQLIEPIAKIVEMISKFFDILIFWN